MKFKLYISLISIASILLSCFKDNENVPPYPNKITTIYNNIEFYQSYYDLESDQVISVNDINAWELGFECGKNGWHIITNSGNYWFIHNPLVTDFNVDYTISGNEKWNYDNQEYYSDSTAVGNWVNTGSDIFSYTDNIYIMGKLQNNNYTEFKKIHFYHVDSIQYKFRYTNLSTGITDTVTIKKSDSVNFVYYSFQEKTQKFLEPSNKKYDLIFTSYFTLATKIGYTLPHLVRGVFLNNGYTFAYVDSITPFDAIDLLSIDHSSFTSQKDIIGYDWKDININVENNTGSYSIRENRTYVIKTQENNYFKLRFISYQLNGENGFPRFEFQSIP